MANVIEASGKNGSIVEDYQYEQNIHSDSQFLKETLNGMEKQDETIMIVTDGAYSGTQNEEMAAEKNVRLVTTNLTGREAEDILADFEFSEDGGKVLKCPGGMNRKAAAITRKPASVPFPSRGASARTAHIKNNATLRCSNV